MKLPSLERIDAELAKRNLKDFIKQAWPVLEPTKEFISGWHLDAMVEHLEAVVNGKISKLIINVPPGHMKSLSVCVFLPAWAWITNPHYRWIFASYGAHLSIRDSIKTRMLITSDWYQNNYGRNYGLVKTNEQLITNNKTGFRYATSVGGVGTGERVHFAIGDDLLRANDARSEAMREQAITHMRAMATRGVAGEHFGQVLIQQRLDERDPTGWAIEQGGWEKLILPAEFESNRCAVTSIGFKDPRTEDGELLWPELFPEPVLKEIKKALGSYDSAAQLQQRPAPEEGGIIKVNLIKRYKTLPKLQFIIDSWDTAFKDKQHNDFSVGLSLGVGVDGGFYLLDRFKAKLQYPALKRQVVSVWRLHGASTILIEDKASGQSLAQELSLPQVDEITCARFKLPVRPISVDRDKIARANACTTTIETNFYVPENAPWVPDYLNNLAVFPNGAHDDDVDATTQVLNYLVLLRGRPPQGININIMGR